jgi:hypothetical protein
MTSPYSRGTRQPSTGGTHFKEGTGQTTGGLNEGIIDAPKIGNRGVRKSVA